MEFECLDDDEKGKFDKIGKVDLDFTKPQNKMEWSDKPKAFRKELMLLDDKKKNNGTLTVYITPLKVDSKSSSQSSPVKPVKSPHFDKEEKETE